MAGPLLSLMPPLPQLWSWQGPDQPLPVEGNRVPTATGCSLSVPSVQRFF